MTEAQALWAYLRSKIEMARQEERGATVPAWILIVVGSVAMAIVAVAAVRAYMNGELSKLGRP